MLAKSPLVVFLLHEIYPEGFLGRRLQKPNLSIFRYSANRMQIEEMASYKYSNTGVL